MADTTPESELVARIRSEELESIRVLVKADLRDSKLQTLDELGRAQELIRQQYTGRYPFELLQNANDAAGDAASAGNAVRFVLSDDALMVADMGAGFGPPQIRAICGLGRSSKDPRKSVGYKGLGFKSVGEITDVPQIFSAAVAFCFDGARVRRAITEVMGDMSETQRLPIYRFPFSLTTEEIGPDQAMVESLLAEGYRTVLRLPLRDDLGRDQVAAHLVETLSPRLLLFLDATERLVLSGTASDFVATVVRQGHADHVEALLESDGDVEHWLVFTRSVDIPDRGLVESLGDAWRQVERVRVAGAVPLGDGGRPVRLEPEPLHVYFPTQEPSGWGLVLQADFSLELDRRRIATNPEAAPYNHWLARQLGDLLGEIAGCLAGHFPGDAQVVSAMAPVGEPSPIGAEVAESALERMAEVAFVPTAGGDVVTAGECIALHPSVPDPARAREYMSTEGLEGLVVPDVETDEFALELVFRLQGRGLNLADTTALLSSPPGGGNDFYEFLVDWASVAGLAFPKCLADTPCVRTLGGEWRRPADGVFFPRQRDEIEFPKGLEIPIVDVPDLDGLQSLLTRAGVNPFEWRQLLLDFVFPLLTDPEGPADRRERALLALRLYHQTERTGDPRLRAQAARVLLPASDLSAAETHLRPAEELYLSSAWTGNTDLETIYGPFGKVEFLAAVPPEDSDELEAEVEFFEWLGVAGHPRTDARVIEQRNTSMVRSMGRHQHAKSYGDLWDRWRERSDVRDATRCDQGHSSSQQLRASYGLDRFPDLVQSGDTNRLACLWKVLALNWGTAYQEARWARFHCQAHNHGGERTRRVRSLMMMMLEELAWVPAVRHGQVALASPSRVWRLADGLSRRLASRVPALPPQLDADWASGLCSDLGVVDAARPKPQHLVQLLQEFADDWGSREHSAEDERSTVDGARWAMRTLNDALAGARTAFEVSNVPLLAQLDGRTVFHTAPYYTDDAYLQRTWESAVPILAADTGLRNLYRALDLEKLDDVATQTPVPLGPRPDSSTSIRADLDRALPYLAAVASDAVPSRSDDVHRGLSLLELEVCERLVVRYELEGETRDREDAVAFLALRQEVDGIIRRNIATAHVELDSETGRPHWYDLGPMLARYLNVPTQGDAFGLLLAGTTTSRRDYLRSRLIPLDAVEQSRILLDQPPEDDLLEALIEIPDVDLDRPLPPVPFDDPPGESVEGPTSDPTQENDPVDPSDKTTVDDDPEPIELPPLDHDGITLTDAAVGSRGSADSPGSGGRGGGGGLGAPGPVDFARREQLKRLIGKRGEEAVYERERERVAASGHDPDRVVWRSRSHPLAPYDIESIDEDGHTMFIEVKSTTGDDPYDTFEISHPELQQALRHRTRFWIYRVTLAHQSRPKVTRFQDPAGLLATDSARLGLSGARLGFVPPDE